MRLETGIHQAAALALYRGAGYAERGPFGSTRPIRSAISWKRYYRIACCPRSGSSLNPSFRLPKGKMMRKLFVTAAVLPLLAFPGVAPADTSLGVSCRHARRGSRAVVRFEPARCGAPQCGRLQPHPVEDPRQHRLRHEAEAAEPGRCSETGFPFANNFRISAGAMFNRNKFSMKGQPTGGTFTINGTTYPASDVGSFDAQVDFNKAAPYIGIGYGRPINSGLFADIRPGRHVAGQPQVKDRRDLRRCDSRYASVHPAAKRPRRPSNPNSTTASTVSSTTP